MGVNPRKRFLISKIKSNFLFVPIFQGIYTVFNFLFKNIRIGRCRAFFIVEQGDIIL